jgi:putative membrane protein
MSPAWRHVAVLSVLALSACGQRTQSSAENVVNATENAFSNAANATGNVIDNASLALTPTPTPQEFIDKVSKSDAFEIAAGQLAKANGSAAAVKEFAQMMIDAHAKSTADLKKAAGGLTPPLTPDPVLTGDQKDKLSDLSKLKGADFDKKYIDGQIDAHEDALALMKKYAADGTEASFKAAAQQMVPVVQRHLDRANEIKGE